MSLKHLSLGERIVMAARLAAAEHLRQQADDAGLDVRRLQNQMAIVRMNQRAAERPVERVASPSLRQDLFRQPDAPAAAASDDDRRVA